MYSLLYVDDEPGLLDIGKLFLEQTGDFTVTCMLSGEEALGLLKGTIFDAIISDYQMPGMDGIDLLKSVRASYGEIPFILFTGRGREEVVIAAINNGADFYLQKGGDPKAQFAELAHKLRQAIIRVHAEKALSDSEKRLADIINFLPDATFAINSEGIVIAWNRAIEEMTGIAAGDILGKGNYEYAVAFYGSRRPMLIDLVFAPDEQFEKGHYEYTRHTQTTLTAETVFGKEGRPAVHLWGKASHLFNENGEITGAIESIRDITDLKKSEIELLEANEQLAASGEELRSQYNELAESERRIQESEEKYRTLVENLQDVAYRTDRKGRLIMVSPSGPALLGYDTPDDLLGKPIADSFYLDPKKRQEFHGILYRDGSVKDFEVELRHRDGTPVFVSTSSHLYYDKEGTVLGIEGILHDITGLKQKEKELKKTYEQVARAQEELRQQYWELEESGKQIRESEVRLRYLLEFYESAQKSEHDLFMAAIEGAGIVTESPMGYLALVSDDESELAMYSWSQSAMAECGMQDKPLVYKTEKTGLWGEAVRQRRAVITNDYTAPNPLKKGYPEGHPKITRHMNVPLIDEGHVVLVVGVANNPEAYTERDARELLLLVQGLWQVIKQKRAKEALHESEMKYRMLVENSHDIIYTINPEGILTFVSPVWTTLIGHPVADVIGKPFPTFVHPLDIPQYEAFLAEVVRTGNRQTGIVYRMFHADGSIRLHTSNITPVFDEQGSLVAYIGTALDITDVRQSENAIREVNRKLNLLNSITRHDVANQLAIVRGYTQMAALRKPDPAVGDFLTKIDTAGNVIERQIEFMRMYQDLGVKAPSWFRIDDLVCSARPADLSVTCTCGATDIFADPMIGRVFFNLFDNAVRHGKTVTQITVRCEKVSENLVITVEDNGVGVPLDEKQKIFEKGYGRHTGFGLFLVREILAITGSSIHETGCPGKGARFEITVPAGSYRLAEK